MGNGTLNRFTPRPIQQKESCSVKLLTSFFSEWCCFSYYLGSRTGYSVAIMSLPVATNKVICPPSPLPAQQASTVPGHWTLHSLAVNNFIFKILCLFFELLGVLQAPSPRFCRSQNEHVVSRYGQASSCFQLMS